MGLRSAAGVTSAVEVWAVGVEPLSPKRCGGTGGPFVIALGTARPQPSSVEALALLLPEQAFQTTAWREGTAAPLNQLVSAAYQRGHVERAYQGLTQNFGLRHCEDRGWCEFHHHASPSITAYGLLMAERLIADKPVGSEETSSNAKCLRLPKTTVFGTTPRAQWQMDHSITTPRLNLNHHLIARLGQRPCCGTASDRPPL